MTTQADLTRIGLLEDPSKGPTGMKFKVGNMTFSWYGKEYKDIAHLDGQNVQVTYQDKQGTGKFEGVTFHNVKDVQITEFQESYTPSNVNPASASATASQGNSYDDRQRQISWAQAVNIGVQVWVNNPDERETSPYWAERVEQLANAIFPVILKGPTQATESPQPNETPESKPKYPDYPYDMLNEALKKKEFSDEEIQTQKAWAVEQIKANPGIVVSELAQMIGNRIIDAKI